MALDELFKTFEFLKKRIEEHREHLSQDETRTRQVLIDPLLKELGWDVGDPNAVELEHRIDKQFDVGMNRADYVLKSGPKLAAVIEAKKLDSPLMDKATTQVLNYANAKGIPWMLVSDGNKWTMYEVFKQGELKDRMRMSFAISETSASECALKSLALWRPNVGAAAGPTPALEPVVIGPQSTVTAPAEQVTEGAEGRVGTTSSVDLVTHATWHPIVGELPKGLPKSVRFAEDAPSPWVSWRQFYTDVANYVLSSGATRMSDTPVRLTKGKNCAINVVPEHPDGRAFNTPARLEGGLWLETHLNSDGFLELSRRFLKAYHSNPESVRVSYD